MLHLEHKTFFLHLGEYGPLKRVLIKYWGVIDAETLRATGA